MPANKTWSTPAKTEKTLSIPCVLCGSSFFKPALKCEGFFYVRCTQCGLIQINPQPLVSEIMNRYGPGEDYLSYELANEKPFLDLQLLALGDADFWTLENDLKKAADKVSVDTLSNGKVSSHSLGKILDIGCATGALLGEFMHRGWDCTGIEISSAQAEYAREKRGFPVYESPVEECCFPDGSFDVVLASHLIEHLNDPASLVREVHRILKEKGRFFVTTPNCEGFQAKFFKDCWRSAIFDHLYLFSIKTLVSLLEKSGFEIEKISTWGGLAVGIAPAIVKWLFDKSAKRFGFGDVMLVRGVKVLVLEHS